jgi:hopanoid biosynthesis associated radical SAM protein HpnH
MTIPAIQKAHIGAYIAWQMLRGTRRFPLVLMLEPSFRCNLRCVGCGKIANPEEILCRRLSVDECVAAAEECGAPIVSIPGSEPLHHPKIHVIAFELASRKKFVYLCTNGLLVEHRIGDFLPSPYLTFNIHLDGLHVLPDSRGGEQRPSTSVQDSGPSRALASAESATKRPSTGFTF